MRKLTAAAGSSLFFALAPGVVAGLGPWWFTRWHIAHRTFLLVPGALLVAAGAAVLVHAFVRFVVEGMGTPAPVAPTQRLVVGGLYRYVRNPMYLAVLVAILGQAMLFGQPVLLCYGAAAGAAMVSFVVLYEEPALRARFGDEYESYRRSVPGWWPRRKQPNGS